MPRSSASGTRGSKDGRGPRSLTSSRSRTMSSLYGRANGAIARSQHGPRNNSVGRDTSLPAHLNGSRRGWTVEQRRSLATKATRILERVHRSPHHNNKADPLDELVFILLSQMTTQPSFDRVFDRLRSGCGSWEALGSMRLTKLKHLIAPAGLSGQKAPRLQSIARRLRKDFGKVTLEPIKYVSDTAAETYLTSLPGVGTKTARCVLMFSLGRSVLPVDTHVGRIARRLGLVGDDISNAGLHDAVAEVVDPTDRHSFHVNAVAHGRLFCRAKEPRCHECPLSRICAHPTLTRRLESLPTSKPRHLSAQRDSSRCRTVRHRQGAEKRNLVKRRTP